MAGIRKREPAMRFIKAPLQFVNIVVSNAVEWMLATHPNVPAPIPEFGTPHRKAR
jgi:hypothetical protein